MNIDQNKLSLERLGKMYFWSDAEKAKLIAGVGTVVFLSTASICAILNFLHFNNLNISYPNQVLGIYISLVSAAIFFLLWLLAFFVHKSLFYSNVLLLTNMLGLAICLPVFFSVIGMFDGFCWSLLFVFSAVGFVIIEPKYIFGTQITTLAFMIAITFLDAELPYKVRAYMVSTNGYIDTFSQTDLLFKWMVMSITTMLSMVTLGFMTGAWQRREEDLRTISYKDELTGLMNRRSILEGLQMEFEIAKEDTRLLSVAMVDLDFFKKINDNYGHLFGDRALKFASDKTEGIVRRHDLVGRYGGEEFLVVFPGCAAEQAANVLNRLRGEMSAEPLSTDEGESVTVSMSAGVAQLISADKDIFSLIERADTGLYTAKENGRDQVIISNNIEKSV